MRFLLDTDHISILQRPAGPAFSAISARMAGHPPGDFALSIVSFHEQVMGSHAFINRARTTGDVVRGYQLLGRVIRDFEFATALLFSPSAAAVFDGLIAGRLRLATMDLRIASIALSRGLTLLTRDARDFSKIQELSIEDWTV